VINPLDSVRPTATVDTLYRLLASLMGLASLCVFFKWTQAPGPVIALGQAGAWLGLPDAVEVARAISSWLTSRTVFVRPIAEVSLFLGLVFNAGAGAEGVSLGRFRGGSSAVLAIAILYEVSPGTLPGFWFATLITVVMLGAVVRLVRRGKPDAPESLSDWLKITAANLIIGLVFVFFLIMGLISGPQSHEHKT
jgi:hypothetical protein